MTDTATLKPAWKDAIYHDHQEYGIRWMMECEKKGYPIPNTNEFVRGGILGDKMGVGKTIQSIGLIVNGDGLNTLVVTILGVRGQWESEFRRSDVNLYLPTQWGQTWKAQGPLVPGRKTVYLTHYDKIASKPELCKGAVYDRIILDEAHIIRNSATKKAQSILKIAKPVKYKWALTGTPITNGMDDGTTYLKFIGFPTAPGKKWQESYMEWAQNIYLSRRLSECPLKGDSMIPPTPVE